MKSQTMIADGIIRYYKVVLGETLYFSKFKIRCFDGINGRVKLIFTGETYSTPDVSLQSKDPITVHVHGKGNFVTSLERFENRGFGTLLE